MSFSKWMSNNSISLNDERQQEEQEYVNSIIFNPSLDHSYKFACFKKCANKADAFKINGQCAKECEEKALSVLSFNDITLSTITSGQKN